MQYVYHLFLTWPDGREEEIEVGSLSFGRQMLRKEIKAGARSGWIERYSRQGRLRIWYR